MSDAGSLAPIDEIYAERNAVALAFANLAVLYGWTVGYTADDPDWPVLFVETPHGQVSWHLKAGELPDDFPPYIGEWDGHTNEEKHRRLRAFVEHGNKPDKQAATHRTLEELRALRAMSDESA